MKINAKCVMLNPSSYPTIREFINVLQKKEHVNRMKIEQYAAGMEPLSNFFIKIGVLK